MGIDRFRPDRGFKYPHEIQLGPNGNHLCRFCRKETDHPNKTFCSEHCLNKFRTQSSGSFARQQVYERDRGICAKCGLDTEKLRQVLYQIRMQKGEKEYLKIVNSYKEKYGYDFKIDRHMWEADHKLAVGLGGGSATLENLTTLCIVCHRKKTKSDIRKMRRKKKYNPR